MDYGDKDWVDDFSEIGLQPRAQVHSRRPNTGLPTEWLDEAEDGDDWVGVTDVPKTGPPTEWVDEPLGRDAPKEPEGSDADVWMGYSDTDDGVIALEDDEEDTDMPPPIPARSYDPDRDVDKDDEDEDEELDLVTDPSEDEDAIGIGRILPMVMNASNQGYPPELEFLLAVCARRDKQSAGGAIRDPHPEDTRWLSKRLANRLYAPAEDQSDSEDERLRFVGGEQLVLRRAVQEDNARRLVAHSIRKMNRVLRRHGIAAMEEDDIQVEGSESELENDRPDWDDVIANFTFTSEAISASGPGGSLYKSKLGRALATQFAGNHCITQGVELSRFPIMGGQDKMEDLLKRVRSVLQDGGWSVEDSRSISSGFRQELEEKISLAGRQSIRALRTAVDPDHLPVVGLKDEYKGWRVIEDVSVDGAGMTPDRYNIPESRRGEVPMARYLYFGAEVVSPVFRARNTSTYENIRKVCGVLRDELRIHKPMEVSTGLHVHMGHKHGWTLLHLKKFVTLWSLIEHTLIHTHRKDRGSERMEKWCGKLTERTNLAYAIKNDNAGIQNFWSLLRSKASPEAKERSYALMQKYVPIESVDEIYREFITEVWEYKEIDDLIDAMYGATVHGDTYVTTHRVAARMRISGNKISAGSAIQTIEIRTMHGTLDAEHIIHWIKVLERVLYYTRRAGREEFSELIEGTQNVATGDLRKILLLLRVPSQTIEFFMHSINRGEDPSTKKEWFVYPDRDIVDWDQPFMVPGYAATHGAEYNIVPLDMSVYD